MQDTTRRDSRSPPQLIGVVTRAETDLENNTAQPPLTSGFGSVIQKEHDLQDLTENSLRHVTGGHAVEIDRILRHQQSRLGANIALLEQRYETLPNPERFVSWSDRHHPPATPRATEPGDEAELLPDLVARHTSLMADIEALIGCGPDGQRGELILIEVRHNHEEMAGMLTALLKEDATRASFVEEGSGRPSKSTQQAEENWDNEGGPVSINPPAS